MDWYLAVLEGLGTMVELPALRDGDEVSAVPRVADEDHVRVFAPSLFEAVVAVQLTEQFLHGAARVGNEEELLDPALLLPLSEPGVTNLAFGPVLDLLGAHLVEQLAAGVDPLGRHQACVEPADGHATGQDGPTASAMPNAPR